MPVPHARTFRSATATASWRSRSWTTALPPATATARVTDSSASANGSPSTEARSRLVVERSAGTPSGHVCPTDPSDDPRPGRRRSGARARGFLLKDAPEEQLVAGIKVVADGGSLFAPAVTRRLIERFAGAAPTQPPEVLSELTPREVEVLRLVARGLANAEIASELVVSEHTAKTHVAHILQKLDARDRVQAVVLAYESGLVRAGG